MLSALRGRNFHSPPAFKKHRRVLQPPARDEGSQGPRRSLLRAGTARHWGWVVEGFGGTSTNTWPAWRRTAFMQPQFWCARVWIWKKAEISAGVRKKKRTLLCWRSCGVLWELRSASTAVSVPQTSALLYLLRCQAKADEKVQITPQMLRLALPSA